MGINIYDDCVERILAEAPDLVDFSAQCTTYPAVIRMSKKIKRRDPHVKIVIRSHNVSFVDHKFYFVRLGAAGRLRVGWRGRKAIQRKGLGTLHLGFSVFIMDFLVEDLLQNFGMMPLNWDNK